MSNAQARGSIVLLVLGVTAALSPVSIDMLAPSLPGLSQDIGASAARTELTIYAFLIGYGVAPSVWGRLSDSIGRRPVMLIGMSIYCLSSLACAYAVSADQLAVLRCTQGIGAAAGATMARAIVRDLFDAKGTVKAMATMISLMSVLPFFTPLVGGLIARQFSWQACFAAMAVVGAASLAAYWLLVGETLQPPREEAKVGSPLAILANRIFIQHTLCNMFCIAVMVIFGANFAFILAKDYQFDSANSGLAMGLFNGSIALGTYLVWVLMPRLGAHRSIVAGCLMCTTGALAIAAQARLGTPPLLGLAPPLVLTCLGCGVVMALCSGNALTPFSHNSGTASSIYLLLQSFGASGISYAVGQLLPKQMVAMSLAMAACGAMALATKVLISGEVAAQPSG